MQTSSVSLAAAATVVLDKSRLRCSRKPWAFRTHPERRMSMMPVPYAAVFEHVFGSVSSVSDMEAISREPDRLPGPARSICWQLGSPRLVPSPATPKARCAGSRCRRLELPSAIDAARSAAASDAALDGQRLRTGARLAASRAVGDLRRGPRRCPVGGGLPARRKPADNQHQAWRVHVQASSSARVSFARGLAAGVVGVREHAASA